jgi:hypothetical protein
MFDGNYWKGLFDKVTTMPSDALAKMIPPQAFESMLPETGVQMAPIETRLLNGEGQNMAGPAQRAENPYSIPLPPNGLGQGGNFYSMLNPSKELGNAANASSIAPGRPDAPGAVVPPEFGPGPEAFPTASNPDPLKQPGKGLTAEQIMALQKAMPSANPQLPGHNPGAPAGGRGLGQFTPIGASGKQRGEMERPGTLRSLIYGR